MANLGNLASNISKQGLKFFGTAAKGIRPVATTLGVDVGIRMLLGDKPGNAVGSAVRDAALLAVAPVAFSLWQGASLIGGLAPTYQQAGTALQDKYNMNRRAMSQPSFQYMDTQQASTMRQAAVQAIQGSKLNARNALGGEAALLHRGYKRERFT
jgi:hypothetical protein